jgi:hypothetical protein
LSTQVAKAGSVDPITLPTLTASSLVVADVDTNLGRWLAGHVKPGTEAVAEATELRNITPHRRG